MAEPPTAFLRLLLGVDQEAHDRSYDGAACRPAGGIAKARIPWRKKKEMGTFPLNGRVRNAPSPISAPFFEELEAKKVYEVLRPQAFAAQIGEPTYGVRSMPNR